MFVYSLGSLGRELQRMHETALGQFHLEAVLALRLCVPQGRISRFLKNGLCRRLTCQFSFGVSRPPGLCSHAAERDASAR
jgi:hypothetical protein